MFPSDGEFRENTEIESRNCETRLKKQTSAGILPIKKM